MEIQNSERYFSNLETLWNGGLRLQTFAAPKRGLAFDHLTRIFRALNAETTAFDNLRVELSRLHWALRGYIGPPADANTYWTQNLATLESAFASVDIYISSEIRELANQLVSDIDSLAIEDSEYSDALDAILEQEHDLVICVEKMHQVNYLRSFVQRAHPSRNVLIKLLKDLPQAKLTSNETVIILAAPRKVAGNTLRRLLFGGNAGNVTFLSPNWLIGRNPSSIKQDLAPGLSGLRLPQITVEGPVDVLSTSDEEIEKFEYLQATANANDFADFRPRGDVLCRLLRLSGGLVMPIESDGQKLSVLTTNETLELVVEYRDPFKSLRPGEIIFDLKDGADESFLLEMAIQAMGSDYNTFDRLRNSMLDAIRSEVTNRGLDVAKAHFKSAGVKTADYIEDWVDNPNFISPRSKKDRINLMRAAGLEAEQIAELDRLTTSIRSNSFPRDKRPVCRWQMP